MRPPQPFNPPRSALIKTNPRQQVLAQWRGIDLAPVEKARAFTARTVQSVMPQVLTKLGLDRRRSETEILKVWNHLIDPTVSAHAQPTGLNKGTLFVTVDSSVWLNEIVRYRRREILERLQHSFGKDLISRISFRVG
jgi:predicted nucleic acid-binding Zn ribbon protein